MPATHNIDQAKGKNAGGAITSKRFVKLDTTATDGETVVQCDTIGEGAYGVSLFSVSTSEITVGKGCSVIIDGRAVMIAGEALAVGDLVMTGADGKPYVATSGHAVLGSVDEPAAAAGDECSIYLDRMGVLA